MCRFLKRLQLDIDSGTGPERVLETPRAGSKANLLPPRPRPKGQDGCYCGCKVSF